MAQSMKRVEEVRCCYVHEPVGVERAPVITWYCTGFVQNGYRVEIFAEDGSVVYDTGHRDGVQGLVELPGQAELALNSRTRYRVQVTAYAGEEAVFAEPAWFETAILPPEVFDPPFITAPGCDTPIFRLVFTLEAPEQGRAYVSALGYGVLYINGIRVSQDRLTPVWSDYHERQFAHLLYPIHDSFSYSTYYKAYDITAFLKPGKNVVSVLVGNGFYNQHDRQAEGNLAYGEPRMKLRLYIQDNGQERMLDTGECFKFAPSPITYNNVYFGEQYDARLAENWHDADYDDSKWQRAVPAQEHPTVWRSQLCPPDRICRSWKPQCIASGKGVSLYDAGVNLSGLVRLTTSAPTGSRIVLTFSEELDPQGKLDFSSAGGEGQIQTDVYIADGRSGAVYTPEFTWHGFRYCRVEGIHDGIEILDIHTTVEKTGDFHCTDDTINFIYDAYIRSQLSNLHGGVPSDCPHRERLGYTGDGQVTAEAALLNLDMAAFYEKWMRDIADSQCRRTGHVQHTAPFYGGGGGPGGWGCAICILPYRFYRHTGDISMARDYFPAMEMWMAYLDSRSEDGIVVREEEGGWCLGDWALPDGKVLIDPAFVNSCFTVYSAEIMAEMAGVLGNTEAQSRYAAAADARRASIKKHYYDESSGLYAGGVQGSAAFAHWIGLDTPRSVEMLLRQYTDKPELDTGIFGTPLLLEALADCGRLDIAIRLLQTKTCPSYGYMQAGGATTLWEFWNGLDSHNHPMLGSVTSFFFRRILGMRCREAGWKRADIVMESPNSLSGAKGKIMTPMGRFAVEWKRKDAKLFVTATVPYGMEARLIYKATSRELAPGTQSLQL